MLCLIAAELLAVSVFKFWPVPAFVPAHDADFVYNDQEILALEEVIPTRHGAAPALPPRPQIPVPVPNDEIIEVDIPVPDLGAELSLNPIEAGTGTGDGTGEGGGTGIAVNPQRPPGLLKIVEPVMPEAARKAGVVAEVYVTFLVGENGETEDVFVSEIRLYEKDKSRYTVVNSIGNGILEATLEAASQWSFRPARDQGRPVKAYTTQVFSFGF